MPHYGIFVMIWGGGYKVSEHFYSAPFVSLCTNMVYLSRMGMGGRGYPTTSILPLCEIMPRYGIIVMIGVGALKYLTTSILLLREIMPH